MAVTNMTNTTSIAPLPTGQRVPRPLSNSEKERARHLAGGHATAESLLRLAAETNAKRLSR